MTENSGCCFSKILHLIDKLQRSVENKECMDNTCSRPFLGMNSNIVCFNTRPVTFYNCTNDLIDIDYDFILDGTRLTGTSNIFRVEKVNGCCSIVSILIPNPDTTNTINPYITTNQTATINLNCVCAIKCLADTVVNL